MKKIFAVLLAFLLVAVLFSSAAEPKQANPAAGDWYASLNGVTLRLSLNTDGTYERALPSVFGEPVSGTWSFGDGFVRPDDGSVLNLVSAGLLLFSDAGLFFTREVPQSYTPAELLSEARPELFRGYWTCSYIDSDGLAVPAEVMKETTDLYVEGTSAVLGGPRFGDVILHFGFSYDMLSADLDDTRTVAIALQQDGLLRLTVFDTDSKTMLYFTRADSGLPDGSTE